QPSAKQFSFKEIEHYREVLRCLRENGIEPVVTLHHFTNPIWFAESGGWLAGNSVKQFLRYVSVIAEALSNEVTYWATINEPLVYTYHSYILGNWPPQETSLYKARKVQNNLARAHIRAYRLIHDIYRKKNLESPMVSIAKNMQPFVPCDYSLRNRFAAALRNRCFNFGFLDLLVRHKSLDYIGLNYYTRGLVDTDGWGIYNLLLDTCTKGHSRLSKNYLGWDIYPAGLYTLLLGLKKYGLPVFILENGICTNDDRIRWDYIYEHLKSMHIAIEEGVNVIGYLYWSLMDNFEWDKGFGPRFGLIEVDYNTYERKIRESARKFALVCKGSELE
ncbi:MAG: family 1 glycosylhydrolase, partial [Candidatus Omnitrophica bacterium]|nr:family 1 glycosylhydrolase [Candidatus Omnitrophota bacterium]